MNDYILNVSLEAEIFEQIGYKIDTISLFEMVEAVSVLTNWQGNVWEILNRILIKFGKQSIYWRYGFVATAFTVSTRQQKRTTEVPFLTNDERIAVD